MVSKKSPSKSQKKSAPKSVPFAVINQGAGNQSWDGSPITLNPNQSARMSETPDGTVLLAYWNAATSNIPGSLAVLSGGGPPQFLHVPPLINQPLFLADNFKGNDLGVTNISLPGVPIRIQLIGVGLPGTTPVPLPSDGTAVMLAPGQTAQGTVLPNWMQLILKMNTGNLAVFAILGGPGNNAYVIALNAPQEAGPGTANPTVQPPAGFYATTVSNVYTYQFNWGNVPIFVANMSPTAAGSGQVSLRQL
ncbi:MAG: hypothetical protein ACJ74T_19585 [Pyrinomonadaceae bacterium]